MDKVIMPELIPPALAEAIAANPEILKTIIDHQPDEEVIEGQNCTLNCGSNPTNVKLLFCNVTIELDENEEGCCTDCGIEVSGVLYRLRLEAAVLEARVDEIKKILRKIPRLSGNRKLVALCKAELNEAIDQLAALKSELKDRT